VSADHQAAHGHVVIGSVVTVQKEGVSEKKKFTIVGTEEVDSSTGKISMKSPLGLALLGKKKKDMVTIKTPAGAATYKIVDID
jgi:transcription elongation GreA/GreB family factor